MNPKEKSQEIVDSMMRTGDPHHTECICFEIAKRCALIAVDEMITLVTNYTIGCRDEQDYWLQVKKEIEQI